MRQGRSTASGGIPSLGLCAGRSPGGKLRKRSFIKQLVPMRGAVAVAVAVAALAAKEATAACHLLQLAETPGAVVLQRVVALSILSCTMFRGGARPAPAGLSCALVGFCVHETVAPTVKPRPPPAGPRCSSTG